MRWTMASMAMVALCYDVMVAGHMAVAHIAMAYVTNALLLLRVVLVKLKTSLCLTAKEGEQK